jgi:hypothetical protein
MKLIFAAILRRAALLPRLRRAVGGHAEVNRMIARGIDASAIVAAGAANLPIGGGTVEKNRATDCGGVA